MTGPAEVEGSAQLTMFGLRNKNKKKNFRFGLPGSGGSIPAKIVFEEQEESSAILAELPQLPPPLPSLIPPSQKQEMGQIPKNMFVTSIDVEAEFPWVSENKRKKGKKKKESEAWEQEWNVPQELDYGAEEGTMDIEPAIVEVDWVGAQRNFENASIVESGDALKKDDLIMWKVNPLA